MAYLCEGDKILMEFSTFGDRFLSIVTEVKRDGRLLVYSPLPEVVLKRMESDRNVLVRYADQGKLKGFKTKVLNQVHSANTVLVLEKPGAVFNAEERFEPRCSCSFPATVVEDGRAAQAVVEDISASCARVRFLNEGIPFVDQLGGDVRLTFYPHGKSDTQIVGCRVKSAFFKNESRYAVLEYKPEEKEARQRVVDFIDTQVCCVLPGQ